MDLSRYELVPYKTIAKTRCGAKALYRGPYNSGHYAYDWVLLEEDSDGNSEGYNFHTTALGEYEPNRNGSAYACDIVGIQKKWVPKEGNVVRVYGGVGIYGHQQIEWQLGAITFTIVSVSQEGTPNCHVNLTKNAPGDYEEYFTHVRNLRRESP